MYEFVERGVAKYGNWIFDFNRMHANLGPIGKDGGGFTLIETPSGCLGYRSPGVMYDSVKYFVTTNEDFNRAVEDMWTDWIMERDILRTV